MNTHLRWALIGASNIAATRLIPAIREVGDSVSVVQSSSAEWAVAYAAEHGIDAWTTSVSELLERPDVDAVYVSSTNEKHHAQVVAAANAGKHVLAEKPLALSVADAREMVLACERAGVVMATNHHLPASPTHRTMKRLVAEGEIGEVLAIHVNHAVWLPEKLRGWRIDDPIGGGVVYDVFIHDMAAVAAIIGGQASSVTAQRRPSASPATDSMMTTVLWDSPVIVQTHDAYDCFDLPTSFEVLGTKGSIRSVGCNTADPIGDVFLFHGHQAQQIDVGPRADLYVTTMRAFDSAVSNGTPVLVTGLDGVRSLSATVAATQALATGRAVEVERV